MMINGMVLQRTMISTSTTLSSTNTGSSMIDAKSSYLLLRSRLSYLKQLTVLLVYKLAVVQELCSVFGVKRFAGSKVISRSWFRSLPLGMASFYYRKDPSVREVRDMNVYRN